MKKIFLMALFVFAFNAVFADSVSVPQFKQIVFLGDSLTDNGNLYKMSAGLLPKYMPYYKGRFSDGYTWADRVSYQLYSRYFIPSQNFAVGGATAVLHNPFNGFLPIDLSIEYDTYEAKNLLTDKDNTLFVIWIGANDYLSGAPNVDQATTSVIDAIVNVVQKLVTIDGAQFLIIDMPDLAVTPEASIKNLTDNYQQLYVMHNAKLHDAILKLRAAYPSTKFMEFNFSDNPILKMLVTSPEYRDQLNKKYHIDLMDVTDPCWSGSYLKNTSTQTIEANLEKKTIGNAQLDAHQLAEYIQANPSLQIAYQVGESVGSGGTICDNSAQHVFWDDVHPTAVVHKVLSKILLKKILSDQ
ncbi:MAG: SGNH/GDSL hydrolase family protein [Gammaproteobacteria bacterium]|nr:SGNH/GDSL hydrolase family protein [Gammaproteobacteria bacterium]